MSEEIHDIIKENGEIETVEVRRSGGLVVQTAIDQQVKSLFLDRVSELWDANWSDFKPILDASEGTKAKMAFGASLDYSDTSPKLKTSITFSKPFSDERLDELGDPNQPELPVFGEGEPAPEPADDAPHITSGDVPEVDGVEAAKASREARRLKRLAKKAKKAGTTLTIVGNANEVPTAQAAGE